MSTSVIHSGTTPQVGRSGRFLGMAAVGLAIVIAGGFVFAANQRNDDSVSRVEAVLSQPAFQAESQRLQGQANYWIARNPDNYPTELKQLLERAEMVKAESHPGFNIEAYKLEQARLNEAAVALGGSADALEERLVSPRVQDLGGSADALERRSGTDRIQQVNPTAIGDVE